MSELKCFLFQSLMGSLIVENMEVMFFSHVLFVAVNTFVLARDPVS
jgi:hypothetical protein